MGDYLGGRHFEREVLAAHPRGTPGGLMLRTFGDARPTLTKWMASGIFSALRIQLDDFDYAHNYDIRSRLKNVLDGAAFCEGLQKKYPGTKLYLSPFCEHNHPARDMQPVFSQMMRKAPSCIAVNSIWKGEAIRGIITEIHLGSAHGFRIPSGPYIVSADGFGGDGKGDFPDCDVPALIRSLGAPLFFLWWDFRLNGKFGHNDPTALADRHIWPDTDYLRSRQRMCLPMAGKRSWPKGSLWKPCADDHGIGGKDNKALCILPERVSEVQLLDSKNKVIDRMTRVLPDHMDAPAGARYYSERYNYQLADIAKRNTGSVLVRVKAGSKIYPEFDPVFRSGMYA